MRFLNVSVRAARYAASGWTISGTRCTRSAARSISHDGTLPPGSPARRLLPSEHDVEANSVDLHVILQSMSINWTDEYYPLVYALSRSELREHDRPAERARIMRPTADS